MIALPRRPKKIKETPLVKAIETALNRMPGVWAMRNNVGSLEDKHGRWVTFGLGTGSPDIVGAITLSPVGALPVAVAFGLEVKTPHARNAHPEVQAGQRAWRGLAERRGMQCAKVTSEAEALDAVRSFRSELVSRLAVLRAETLGAVLG
jgi:hypothetical protein